MFLTLLAALILPIGVPLAMTQVDETPMQVAVAVAVVFAALWLLSVPVGWRAAGKPRIGLATRRSLVATVLLVGLAAAGAWLRTVLDDGEPDGFDVDALGIQLIGFAVLTFAVVAMLLSGVRSAAHRIKAR